MVMKSFRQDVFNQDWILAGDRQKAKVEFGATDFPLNGTMGTLVCYSCLRKELKPPFYLFFSSQNYFLCCPTTYV